MRIGDWSSDVCFSALLGGLPVARHQRRAVFRQLDGRLGQHAEPRHEFALAVGADIDRHLGRADIRRIHVDFRHTEPARLGVVVVDGEARSEEHTSELQSLMSISYAVFCLKKKNNKMTTIDVRTNTYKTR